MKNNDWTSFGDLHRAVSTAEAIKDRANGVRHTGYNAVFVQKRRELAMQYERFLQADEDNILLEYEQLQRLHREMREHYTKMPTKATRYPHEN